MRFAVVAIVAFVCSCALASEPGSALDCSDMTLYVPGLTCNPLAPFGQPDSRWTGRGSTMAVDNEGFVYVGFTRTEPDGVEIHRSRDGGQTVEVVARINARSAPQGWDRIRFSYSAYAPAQSERIQFDPTGGRLLIWLESQCQGSCPCGSFCSGAGYGGNWTVSIEGFAPLLDIFQSYVPPAATVGFTVPAMPEGMAGADHFNTYWGPLTKPLDFTQAHPLACDYPASSPHVGDYLTVADTVPTPAPGQGVYYVTSATYQGATRYGRKTTAGHLTGRDPALLPACTP